MDKIPVYYKKYSSKKIKQIQFRNGILVFATFVLFFLIPAHLIYLAQIPTTTSENNLGRVAGASTQIAGDSVPSIASIQIDQNTLLVILGILIVVVSIILLGFILWSDRRPKL